MTDGNSPRKQNLTRIRRALALGLVLPSLFLLGPSIHAQTSKSSITKKTSKVAKPSSGVRSSVSKRPSVLGSRVNRSDSIGLSSNSTMNRSSRSIVSGSTGGGNGLSSTARRRDSGISNPFTPPPKSGQLRGRSTDPGLNRLPKLNMIPKLPGSVTKLPRDVSNRTPRDAKPDLGKLLPGRSKSSASVIKPHAIKPGKLPKANTNTSNRELENIIGGVNKPKLPATPPAKSFQPGDHRKTPGIGKLPGQNLRPKLTGPVTRLPIDLSNRIPRKPVPEIGKLPGQNLRPKLPGPVTKLPIDLSNRIPRKPVPEIGKLLPGAIKGSPHVIESGKLPSITESNRKFEDILGRISELKPKPLNIKEITKELPRLSMPTEDNPLLKMQRQEMVMGARKTMGLRFGIGAGCHWWADLLCGWHWHRHGCHWTDLCAVPGYWSCWRPCHYRVVWCPTVRGHVRSAWYFGIESFLIPDMHALGVHEVSPYSPAALAGLQPGDMILSVNGYAFDNESVLPEMIQTSSGLLNLEVYREGLEAPMTVQVRLRRLRITSH
ncbi:MAG TPA: hypothetical protein DEF45_26820 [Rhodopirellula sp.]|nr:hypothetical protein [Rhodopirellula sp.]